MQAIVTKFIGPSNTRGSRYKATCSAGSVTVSADHSKNPDRNHLAAAEALVNKLGWLPTEGRAFEGVWHGGFLPDGSGCFVFACDDGFELAFSTGA